MTIEKLKFRHKCIDSIENNLSLKNSINTDL
jgi:hypothetical protein